jgi:hypothetical protein
MPVIFPETDRFFLLWKVSAVDNGFSAVLIFARQHEDSDGWGKNT